jgi:cellulase
MECVQIKVTSAGAKTLPAGVAIPGTYTATDPGILFNLYGAFTSYTIPGPKVWDGASGGAAPVASSAAPAVTSKAAVVTSAPVVVATSAKPVVTSAKPVVTSAKPVVTSAKPVVTSAPVVVKTTLVTLVRSSTKAVTVIATPTSAPTTGGSALKYAQCGGTGFTGKLPFHT